MRPKKSARRRNRAYHDRVAGLYDDIYRGARHRTLFEVAWEGMRPHLPADLARGVCDLGCGTGLFGLRLAKSGYRVTLSDLSPRMLDQALRKAAEQDLQGRVESVAADLMDLSPLGRERFALAVAQGDPLSFVAQPRHALREIRRTLEPGGVLVGSVDQTLAQIDHLAGRLDVPGLEELASGGATVEWLSQRREERFPVHTFTAESLCEMLRDAGFQVLDLFGKTVLPLKLLEPALQDPGQRRALLAVERRFCRLPSALGRAPHLQFAARRADRV